jgi:biopolymer transport protein ExbD
MAIPTSKASAKLRARWHRFRLDMTPMVDMAFLLLTFLLLHAAYAKPHIMQLTMPVKGDYYERSGYELHEYGAISIMLGYNHTLYYYYRLNNPLDSSVSTPEVKRTDFGPHGIRQVLLTKEEPIESVILIKPTPGATYKDIVDILDEMNITSQKKYALVKISANDTDLLRKAGY